MEPQAVEFRVLTAPYHESCAVLEPAILLATGTEQGSIADDLPSAQYFTLACVSYGEPLPSIEWFARRGDTEDRIENGTDNFILSNTTVTTNFLRYDIESVVSILIGCEADLDDVTSITCLAGNGLCVNDSVGFQQARFDLTNNLTTSLALAEVSRSLLHS